MNKLSDTSSCGIYIHIPFCIQKCLYCDFTSYTGRENIHAAYIDSLISEMREFEGVRADTVFIGGGTPTILAPYLLEKLLYNIHDIFNIEKSAEISAEANPKTIDAEKISVLKKYINRISVGVQSFNDNELAALGRVHNAREAYDTVLFVRDNFENFNIDIMSSIPNQTEHSFRQTLETAVKLDPPHISCYSLILEEGTALYDMNEKGVISLPDEDFDRDMYAFANDFLASHGFLRYEISNYAKPGFECRHNIKYWSTEEYLGFGAAAHSYKNGIRYSNSGDPAEYMNGRGGGSEKLSEKDMIGEFMFMGMRMTAGISAAEFKRRFSKSIYDVYGDVLREKIEKGLIKEKNGRFFLSGRGIDVSNYVLCDFIL
ncbi:MAG: oxygen-independent coproporphyrinogen III oxidase [Oscillospiraceae bacterium]|nr:oxygen-independent coproporphyrinogen III oxidase [Oscillospiraceae bacterium]